MQLHLASYRASAGDWKDRLIAKHTRSEYSHCELVFSMGTDAPSRRLVLPQCFSSSPRDGGTRWKDIDLYDGKWDLVPVHPAVNVATVFEICRRETGKPYDWPGVFAFGVPFIKHDDSRWFCSEVCTFALQGGGMALSKPTWKHSPADARNAVRNMW